MSLGLSPTTGSSFPSPPLAVGSLPRGGGILINKSDDGRHPSLPTSPIIVEQPPSPLQEKRLSLTIPDQPTPMSGSGSGSASQRIRFAPLPDPIRPRSLSTGGESTWNENQEHQTVLVKDVKGYDNALESEDDDDDEYHKRGRRWSKSMGMGSVDWGSGWKGTKKILTMGLIGDEEEGYSEGAPLKKSVSTGGFVGSWSSETERKKTMLGTSPSSTGLSLTTSRDSSAHRRGSSVEVNGHLATSPAAKPVKMLNGRVYGGRRASEAAEAEKKMLAKNEPEFVEWGQGKNGGGMGSNQPAKRDDVDEDDGSGMDWVRKRRQRREQQEREKQERDARQRRESDSALSIESGGDSDSSESQKANQGPITPSVPSSELPPPPIIQVSEHLTPYDSAPSHLGGPASPSSDMGKSPSNAMSIMAARKSEARDVFDEQEDERKRDSSDEGSDDEEEDDDDGDFSEDDEEEEELRTTSTAAGVEKISRHREQNQPRDQNHLAPISA